MQTLNEMEKKLINGWQKGFPLTKRPYAKMAADLQISEAQVIELLASLKERGILSRVGAVVRPNTVAASSLVAMNIEPDELDYVAGIVCAEPQVNHNYEREGELNLWFVVAAPSLEELHVILARIEKRSGYKTIKLPLTKAYHIDLGFQI